MNMVKEKRYNFSNLNNYYLEKFGKVNRIKKKHLNIVKW